MVKPQELLTIVRNVGDRVKEDKKRCILEGVESLPTKGSTVRSLRRNDANQVVTFCLERIKLLVADKTGGFILVAEDIFLVKAKQAVQKNFKKVGRVSLIEVKERAAKMCESMGLDRLKASVTGAKGLNLEVFFLGRL